ncbi:MAG: hypothetical protein R2912_05175 [Eubacteriales bacterium]
MTNETAAYLKLLLHGGLKDVFFQQLEEMLNDAPVLEGVLLELSYIDDDIERAISCLNDYLLGKRVDYDSVAEMIRTQVWDLFCNRRLRQSEVVSALCCMAENTGFETVQPWCSMSGWRATTVWLCRATWMQTDLTRHFTRFYDKVLFLESISGAKSDWNRIISRRAGRTSRK